MHPVQRVSLLDFKPDPHVPHPTILLVGKRASGKSTMSVALAEMYNHVERWAAFCGTKETQDYWAERFGSPATVWGANATGVAALHRIIRYQEKKIQLYRKVLHQPFPKRYTIGLIFDDVTANREFRRGELLEDLFSNGRHYKTVIIVSCQYIKQIPPSIRTNADYLVLLHNSKRTCKILYEEFVENPETYRMFLTMLQHVTGAVDPLTNRPLYNALVYDNGSRGTDLSDIFYVFRHRKSFDVKQVHLGAREWRAFNSENYIDRTFDAEKKKYEHAQRLERISQYHANMAHVLKEDAEECTSFVLSSKAHRTVVKFPGGLK